jgi:hypothetical protein
MQYQHTEGLRIEEQRNVEETALGEEKLEGLKFGKSEAIEHFFCLWLIPSKKQIAFI